jgi:hypothetical protein
MNRLIFANESSSAECKGTHERDGTRHNHFPRRPLSVRDEPRLIAIGLDPKVLGWLRKTADRGNQGNREEHRRRSASERGTPGE